MNKSTNNLQDIFLNQARKGKVQVTIHLSNGYQLRGFVKGFDSFTIILDNDGKQIMIYKHSVSTIVPLKPLLYTIPQSENIDYEKEED